MGFLALLATAGPAQARLVTIDFESEILGHHFNGYESQQANGVFFSSTESVSGDVRDYLTIDDFGQGSQGRALAISTGNPALEAGLVIDFSHATDFVSLEFGNDDPFGAFTGLADAVLTLFHGGNQVGQAHMAPNGNGIMDQTIAFTGAWFDRVEFFFIDDFGFPALINPIVDNIRYNNPHSGAAVPEPRSLMILGIGLLALVFRKKAPAA